MATNWRMTLAEINAAPVDPNTDNGALLTACEQLIMDESAGIEARLEASEKAGEVFGGIPEFDGLAPGERVRRHAEELRNEWN